MRPRGTGARCRGHSAVHCSPRGTRGLRAPTARGERRPRQDPGAWLGRMHTRPSSTACLLHSYSPFTAAFTAAKHSCFSASANAQRDGRTPLFMAAQNGHFEVVRALLDGKASPDKAQARLAPDEPSMAHCHSATATPAHSCPSELWRARHRSSARVRSRRHQLAPGPVARRSSCRICAPSTHAHALRQEDGRTPFFMACHNGHEQSVRLLLASDIDPDKTSVRAVPIPAPSPGRGERYKTDHSAKTSMSRTTDARAAPCNAGRYHGAVRRVPVRPRGVRPLAARGQGRPKQALGAYFLPPA